jgi:hypothetical protein
MSKGAYVTGNTQPWGEIVREVVGPPGTAADATRVVEQTYVLHYQWVSSSGAVFKFENPHDVKLAITGIYVNTLTAPVSASSGRIAWGKVASSSATGTGAGLGRFSSSVGMNLHFTPTSSGVGDVGYTLDANGGASAWLTGRISLAAGSSAKALAYVKAIPLYST